MPKMTGTNRGVRTNKTLTSIVASAFRNWSSVPAMIGGDEDATTPTTTNDADVHDEHNGSNDGTKAGHAHDAEHDESGWGAARTE